MECFADSGKIAGEFGKTQGNSVGFAWGLIGNFGEISGQRRFSRENPGLGWFRAIWGKKIRVGHPPPPPPTPPPRFSKSRQLLRYKGTSDPRAGS